MKQIEVYGNIDSINIINDILTIKSKNGGEIVADVKQPNSFNLSGDLTDIIFNIP